jgi:lipopolysaccharide/colanic/teichoic acid biosynthesis glycosyltransferase
MIKRLFDIIFSIFALIILSPVFAAASVLIKLDSEGPVFFLQERVGRNFKPFRIYKFRSMRAVTKEKGALITVRGDERITRVGRMLRKYKIDELPQLINVLKGEMSLVGPRPEVRQYVQLFRAEYRKLLRMRPGITDPASIKFSEEENVLATAADWEEDYIKRILPEKLHISLRYVEKHSFITDLKLIFRTVFRIAENR